MTIERERYDGPISLVCDGVKCHEYLDTHCEVFSGALAKAKARGWKVRKVNGEWLHFCSDCA